MSAFAAVSNSLWSMSLFSVSYWNIGGLNSTLFGHKLNTVDRKHNANSDICVISKAWGCNPNFDILPGYTLVKIDPIKHINTSRGRAPGGIAVLHKSNLKMEILKKETNYLWLQVFNYHICATYFLPYSSRFFDESLFEDLDNDIANFSQSNTQVLILGDFNARTSNLDDIIQNTDSHFTNTGFLTSERESLIQDSRSKIQDPEFKIHTNLRSGIQDSH